VARTLLFALITSRATAGLALGTPSADLHSGDAVRVAAALDALGAQKSRAAVVALASFVREGQVDALADRAALALGDTRSPEALDVLGELTRHRRAGAREASYRAIAKIPGARADALLGTGLRDSASPVRVVCARSLGERSAKSQLDLLFLAFDRGVAEAGVAIGQIADGPAVSRLHERLGHAPIQPMLGAYEKLLLRADVPESTKLDVLARLGEVATPNVKLFLQGLMGSHDWSKQLPVLRAMADTAARIAAPGKKP
jgi:HEAT repeat protein